MNEREPISRTVLENYGMDSDQLLNSNFVDQSFEKVIEHGQERGPKPIRAIRIRDVFRNQVHTAVPIDQFEKAFSDAKNPRNSAQTAISWLNRAFDRLGINLEIESTTAYRLRQRPPE